MKCSVEAWTAYYRGMAAALRGTPEFERWLTRTAEWTHQSVSEVLETVNRAEGK